MAAQVAGSIRIEQSLVPQITPFVLGGCHQPRRTTLLPDRRLSREEFCNWYHKKRLGTVTFQSIILQFVLFACASFFYSRIIIGVTFPPNPSSHLRLATGAPTDGWHRDCLFPAERTLRTYPSPTASCRTSLLRGDCCVYATRIVAN